MIAAKPWTDANPELATRTVRAFVRAHQAMHDPVLGPQARDKVHAKFFADVDKGIFDIAWQRMLPGFASNLAMNRGQLERVEKFLNDFSSEKMNADLDKVFTNRFVRRRRADQGLPKVAMRSTLQTNSTRFSSIAGSRSP